jgi:CheY-like chemotaxis protein
MKNLPRQHGPAGDGPGSPASRLRSILWIEDQPAEVKGARRWLQHLGHEVELAEDTESALSHLRDVHVDLLLVDERLSPHGDSGSSVIRQLRSGELGARNAGVPFLFVTGFANDLDQTALTSDEGCLGVIHKADDLVEAIGETLGQLVTVPGLVDAEGRPLSADDPSRKDLFARLSATEAAVLEALRRRPVLMRNLHPRDFEELIGELFTRNGFRVEMTPSTHDGGADLYAVLDTNLDELRFAVECKRYAPDNPVGPRLVRELRGVVNREQAVCRGVLVTTSRFTKGAYKEQRATPAILTLQDFDRIAGWLRGEPIFT